MFQEKPLRKSLVYVAPIACIWLLFFFFPFCYFFPLSVINVSAQENRWSEEGCLAVILSSKIELYESKGCSWRAWLSLADLNIGRKEDFVGNACQQGMVNCSKIEVMQQMCSSSLNIPFPWCFTSVYPTNGIGITYDPSQREYVKE